MLKREDEWEVVSRRSEIHLRDYIDSVSSFNRELVFPGDFGSAVEKIGFLRSDLTSFCDLFLKMRDFFDSTVKLVDVSSSDEDLQMLLLFNEVLQMYSMELDSKERFFLRLHVLDSSVDQKRSSSGSGDMVCRSLVVLNSYLIAWKYSPYLDVTRIKKIKDEMKLSEKRRAVF